MLATAPAIDAAFVRERLMPAQADTRIPNPPVIVVADPEERRLRMALRQTNGNKQLAAQILGISRSTLWRKMKHYGLV